MALANTDKGKKDMIKKFKLDWPQTTLACVAIATLGAVYVLSGDSERDSLEKAVLAVWAFLASFLGPMLRKRVSDDDA